jgi:hypothetical protein
MVERSQRTIAFGRAVIPLTPDCVENVGLAVVGGLIQSSRVEQRRADDGRADGGAGSAVLQLQSGAARSCGHMLRSIDRFVDLSGIRE